MPRHIAIVFCAVLGLAAPSSDAWSRGHGRHFAQPTATAVAGQFDYYLLSLSWSPAYCESHRSDRSQCGTTKFGFVLHGLWPQFDRGGYPDCTGMAPPADAESRTFGKTVFPSEKLVAHEWDRHGACTGLTPRDYFRLADDAHRLITIPDRLQPGDRTTSMRVQDVSALLRGSNPRLTANTINVTCAKGELSEVHVCLDKKLNPRACGPDVHDQCPAGGTIGIRGVK